MKSLRHIDHAAVLYIIDLLITQIIAHRILLNGFDVIAERKPRSLSPAAFPRAPRRVKICSIPIFYQVS